ncbi:hypothetical protein IJG22_00645 [Candidatus Saccharibacteria bacterium]|nr:hypothetical protein [Candidatus Saccharibacteria bacterium]
MKSKDIRKENTKHKNSAPSNGSKAIDVDENGYKYHIVHDHYNAIISRPDTGEVVGIYKAANRSWKKMQGFVSNNVRVLVENLYT